MEHNNTKAILAGNYAEFLYHKKRFGDDSWRYIGTPHDYMGAYFDSLKVIGTFWEREDSTGLYNGVSLRLKVKK